MHHDLEGERKQLTVLFADVQGSMELQEGLDPERWAEIVGRVVEILADSIGRFGGTLDKFTGDGVMAVFGAPVAQEDHARRACHAGWHLLSAVAAFADGLRDSDGVDLQIRAGINSGEVIVGRVGKELRLDATALGHPVSLARRMEALAEPGRAFLSEHTAQLVGGWFDLTDLGAIAVKGARAPLHVFTLDGPASEPPWSRTTTTLAASRLIGRESELAILEDILVATSEARFQVVGVVGEAGVGKSRLCEEFCRIAARRSCTVHRTTGVSHGREVPLLPILALVRSYFSISERDSRDEARAAVTERVLALDMDLEDELPLLLDFLGIPDPERPVPRLAPEVRMRRIVATLRRLTERRSEREPLVLLVEDLHWFDTQSAGFLERLIEPLPGSRTLVLTNFRPEFHAAWMRHSHYRQLSLSALSGPGVAEMIRGLLGHDPSLATLEPLVLEHTGGNPFFIEEVLRTLVEDGSLRGEPGGYGLVRPVERIRLPAGVQAVLAARMDRLEPEHKRVLQTAAVIGRSFPEPVLAQVTGLADDALGAILSALCTAELLQVAPAPEYRLWHPLTQEVAYQTLLVRRRATLHAAVAEALIVYDADHLDERAAAIALHWDRAGRPLEAARWTLRAGHFALRSDLREGGRLLQAAIELLVQVEETPDSLDLGVRARQRLLQMGARMGIVPDQVERLEAEGRRLAERLGDVALFRIITAAGSPRVMGSDVRGGLDRFLEASDLLAGLGDPVFDATVWLACANAVTHVGPLEQGLTWAERALDACGGRPELGADFLGFSALARTLQIRARLLASAGRLGDARADLANAITLLRQRVEPESLAWTLAVSPILASLSGDGNDAMAHAEEAARIAQDTGNLAVSVLAMQGLALAHLLQGQPDLAVGAANQALAEARAHGSGLFEEASVLTHLARAELALGHGEAARTAVEEALELARARRMVVMECLALLTRAKVLRAFEGRGAEASIKADLEAALTLVEESGARSYRPFIHEELGLLTGDVAEVQRAARLFHEVGAFGHARRVRAALS